MSPLEAPTVPETDPALRCQRDRFSLPDDVHWLNCAYLSPLSRAVEAAGVAGIRKKAVPTAIGPSDFFDDSDTLRALFARLINVAAPESVAILPSVSYGLAVCARNIELRPGQNVVTLHEQFPGNVYVWRELARRAGARLTVVRPPEGVGQGPEFSARIQEAITPDTAAVALGQVHWTDGTLIDLDAVSARAREVGAAFIVDGTQTVGALPFDVERYRPDAVIVAGYKWLMGPYSIALGYYGPRFAGGIPLEETWIARRGSENFAGLVDYVDEYHPGAIRYDVGQRSNFILVPMLIEALRSVLEWRPERIQAYCRDLTRDVFPAVRDHGYGVEDEGWRGAHMFGLTVPEQRSAEELQSALLERGVYVSRRGRALRISPHVYNDDADIGALVEVLTDR